MTTRAAESRASAVVIGDFEMGAARLEAMAVDWREGQFKQRDIADADAILRGLGHCLTELRQGASVAPGGCADGP